MKELNKYILVVLNQKSTPEEIIRNVKDAYAAYLDAYFAYFAAGTISSDAYVAAVAAYDTAIAHASSAAEFKKHIDRFFEIPGENIQDYYDEIKIINKDK